MTSIGQHPLPPELSPGAVIAGKYQIDRVLGVGGMGIVVAAHHLQLEERVALKMLLPETLMNSEAVARFAREARAAVKIKSEHVARVSDVGTLPDGGPYLVMEYLEGEDLSHWVANRGALSIEQAVEFVLQAAEAIAEAHSLGIVHRDLKPANLFVVRRADGLLSVKVLDFGISKAALDSTSPNMGMTKTTAVMGSPLYMSPEQMQSARSVDARGDIWALGAILFELLAATTPFTGESFPELVLNVAGKPPRLIRQFRPDVPVALEQVILKCLEKDRNQRFQNVGELAVALLDFGPKRARSSVERVSRVIQASGLSASALALPPSTDKDAEAQTQGTLATWGKTGAPPTERKRRTGLFFALGGAAAVAGGAALFLSRSPHDAEPQPEPPVPATAAPHQEAVPAPVVPGPPTTVTAPAPNVEPSPVAATGVGATASASPPAAAKKPVRAQVTPSTKLIAPPDKATAESRSAATVNSPATATAKKPSLGGRL